MQHSATLALAILFSYRKRINERKAFLDMIITNKEELFKAVIVEGSFVKTLVEIAVFTSSRAGNNVKRSKEFNQLREVEGYHFGDSNQKQKN